MPQDTAPRDVIRWAESVGCTITKAHTNHFKVYYEGVFVGTIGSTYSERKRSNKNARSFISRNIRRVQAGGCTL